MAEAEHVVVRGVMAAAAVLVAPARAQAPSGEEERECDRKKEQQPGTRGHARSLNRGTSDWQSTLGGGRPLAVTQSPTYE